MSDLPPSSLKIESFDGTLGRRIISIHRWAVDQGLRGAPAEMLFDEFCRLLVEAGVPLWRAFAGVQTLHPQWAGYAYTWIRDKNAVQAVLRERDDSYRRDLRTSPFASLMPGGQVAPRRDGWPHLRRRLSGPDARLDFPILQELA